MAWHRIGDTPLSEPMLTRFTDAYMQHKGEMSFNLLHSPVDSLYNTSFKFRTLVTMQYVKGHELTHIWATIGIPLPSNVKRWYSNGQSKVNIWVIKVSTFPFSSILVLKTLWKVDWVRLTHGHYSVETLCFKLGRCRLALYCWLDSKITLWIAVERVIIWSKDWSCATIWGGMQKQTHHRLPKTGAGLKRSWGINNQCLPHFMYGFSVNVGKFWTDWQNVNTGWT